MPIVRLLQRRAGDMWWIPAGLASLGFFPVLHEIRAASLLTPSTNRHTVTSCKMPCNGQYVANYPQPDGYFDSGKMGNYDYIDGGLLSTEGQQELLGVEYEGPGIPKETYPTWELDTTDLEPGMHSYYCRVHPWMRGWMEVSEPET